MLAVSTARRPDPSGRPRKAIAGSRVVYHLARANVRTWDEFTEQDIEVTRHIAETCLCSRVRAPDLHGNDRLVLRGSQGRDHHRDNVAGSLHRLAKSLCARAKAVSENLLMASPRTGSAGDCLSTGHCHRRGGSPFQWGIGMWSWNAVCQIWGQGRNPLPFVLVEDVAQALVAAVDVAEIEGESFNLVAETDLTAFDYLKALEEHAGVSFQKFPTPLWKFYAVDLVKWAVKQMVRHPDKRRPSYRDWVSRTQRAHYDCTKARRLLNWNPVSDRDEIVRRGIQQSNCRARNSSSK